MAKLALLCHFACVSPSLSPEGLSEQKARNRVNATRNLSIPNDCILSITVFHVAMVLTQRRRCRRRWNVNVLSAMLLRHGSRRFFPPIKSAYPGEFMSRSERFCPFLKVPFSKKCIYPQFQNSAYMAQFVEKPTEILHFFQ